MTTVATWSVKLEPGKPYKFTALEDEDMNVVLRISNASLGFNIADESARTVVKITKVKSYFTDDPDEIPEAPETEEIALCALIPGKIEQVLLGVEFDDALQQIEVVGPNEVHLLGMFINQDDGPDSDSEIYSDGDDDLDGPNGYRLDEISSDVEVEEARFDFEDDSEDDDADRFEEVDEKKSLKRPADAMDEDTPASTDGLSKKQKKKLAKKLKNEDGAPVSVSADTAEKPKSTASAAPDSKKEDKKDKKEKKEDKKSDKKEEKKEKGAAGEEKTLPGDLKVKDATVGTGKAAKVGNTLSMRYIGKLENGKVFDSNTKGKPFTFKLGAGEVIKGWDQGIVGMQVGGERVLTIPAPLAYGKRGSKPDIPPNATLRFEIKLIDIK